MNNQLSQRLKQPTLQACKILLTQESAKLVSILCPTISIVSNARSATIVPLVHLLLLNVHQVPMLDKSNHPAHRVLLSTGQMKEKSTVLLCHQA